MSPGAARNSLCVCSLLRLPPLCPGSTFPPEDFQPRREGASSSTTWSIAETALPLSPLSLLWSRAEIFLSPLSHSLCWISESLFHPRLFPSLLPRAACSRWLCHPFYLPTLFEQEVSRFSWTVFANFIVANPLLGLRSGEGSTLGSAMALLPSRRKVSFILGMPQPYPANPTFKCGWAEYGSS